VGDQQVFYCVCVLRDRRQDVGEKIMGGLDLATVKSGFFGTQWLAQLTLGQAGRFKQDPGAGGETEHFQEAGIELAGFVCAAFTHVLIDTG